MYHKCTRVSLCFDVYFAPSFSNASSIKLSMIIARRNIHSLLFGLCSVQFLCHPKGPAKICKISPASCRIRRIECYYLFNRILPVLRSSSYRRGRVGALISSASIELILGPLVNTILNTNINQSEDPLHLPIW